MKLSRFWRGYLFGWFLVALFICCVAASCDPSNVNLVDNIATIAAGIIPIASGVASDLLPQDAALITASAGGLNAALAVTKSVTAGYEANPSETTLAAVQDATTTAQAHAADILTAAQVKNSTTAVKIAAVASGVSQSLALVESRLVAQHPATVAAAAAKSTS